MGTLVSCQTFLLYRKMEGRIDTINLIGVGTVFRCRRFPAQVSIGCLATLSGGRGEHEVSVWLERGPDDQEALHARREKIDPVAASDFYFTLRFDVPEAGLSILSLRVDGEPLATRRARFVLS